MLIPVYLDQCIVSRLQHGDPEREDMQRLLNRLRDRGCIFVVSDVHIREIHQSARPKEFLKILNDIGAYFIPSENLQNDPVTAEFGTIAQRFADYDDPILVVQRSLQGLFKIMNFTRGGLDGAITATELLEQIAEDGKVALEGLFNEDFPPIFKPLFDANAAELGAFLRSIDIETMRNEAVHQIGVYKSGLPNYAQIDALPVGEAVATLIDALDGKTRKHVTGQFPRGFWRDGNREYGNLAAFAFMLFELGLARDSRTHRKTAQRRNQHYLGQFRDCEHIEHAAHCAVFLTREPGAARLASGVYDHAGAETVVWQASPATP